MNQMLAKHAAVRSYGVEYTLVPLAYEQLLLFHFFFCLSSSPRLEVVIVYKRIVAAAHKSRKP